MHSITYQRTEKALQAVLAIVALLFFLAYPAAIFAGSLLSGL